MDFDSGEKKQSVTWKYGLAQGFYWMMCSAFTGFASVYLLNVGFSNTEIGVLIAVAGALSAALQPVVATLADESKVFTLKRIIIGVYAAMIVCAGVVLALYGAAVPLAIVGLTYGVTLMLMQVNMPLLNALGTEAMNQGYPLNWGFARGFGSVFYAVNACILGVIVEKTGVFTIPVMGVFALFLCVGSVVVYPPILPKQTSGQKGENAGNPLVFFRKYPKFALLLVGFVLIYIGHTVINNFAFQIVQDKGGDSTQMGVAIALAAIVELAAFNGFASAAKKIRCDTLIRISGVFFTLKVLMTYLAPNILMFYVAQCFQIMAWGLMVIASVYYVNAIMKPEDTIKGQAYNAMTYTLSIVFGSTVGGRLLDFAGVSMMLVVALVLSALGSALIFAGTERVNISQQV